MTQQTIQVGDSANDRKGDSIRAAFQKVNANFTELYTALGLDEASLNLGAFEFTGSTLTTTDSSDITIDQRTTITSDLTVGGDILPQTANDGDLGSAAKPWRSLYVSNNTIYLGEAALGINQSGELTVNGSSVAGSATPAWADITGKPTFAAVATSGSYADLSNKPTIPSLSNFTFSGNNILNTIGDIINIQAPFSQLLSTDGAFIWVEDGYGAGIEVNSNIWKFDASGDLTFPDTTVQTTAYRIVNTYSGSNRIAVGGQTAAMDYLTIRLAFESGPDNTNVELNYDPDSTTGISVDRRGTNLLGVQVTAPGNTTWDIIDTLNTAGDGTEFVVTDHSLNRIYRVTVTVSNPHQAGSVTGDGYCAIERLK